MSDKGAISALWHRSRPRPGVLAVLGLAPAAFLLMSPAVAPAAADSQQDAQTVICLSPGRTADLIAAAVALRLAASAADGGRLTLADGRSVSVADWRQQRPNDFRRACTALTTPIVTPSAPARESNDSLQNLLTSFGSAFSGALVGSVVTVLSGAAARRRELSGRVESTGLEFRQAADAYLDARVKQPAEVNLRGTQLNHARNEAVAVLDRVAARYPTWPTPAQLRRRLTGPVLGPALTSNWPTEQSGRDARIDLVRAELDQARTEFTTTALGTARLRRTHRTPAAVP